jgi:hypothetical protein
MKLTANACCCSPTSGLIPDSIVLYAGNEGPNAAPCTSSTGSAVAVLCAHTSPAAASACAARIAASTGRAPARSSSTPASGTVTRPITAAAANSAPVTGSGIPRTWCR